MSARVTQEPVFETSSEQLYQRRGSFDSSLFSREKRLSVITTETDTNIYKYRRHSLATATKGEHMGTFNTQTKGHFAGERTDTTMRSLCDLPSKMSNVELKPILKFTGHSFATKTVADEDSQVNNCNSRTLADIRCCYRLPTKKHMKTQKSVSFREDLVFNRFKHATVSFASP